MTRLLDDDSLEASSVVANCAMNRERQLAGPNSYERELGFHPLGWLASRGGDPAWLDLCCGTGRPLIQAAAELAASCRTVTLVGVDLVDYFDPLPPENGPDGDGPELVCASVASWEPSRRFDLITCVHGLHYVGDKLGVLARAAGWLAADGRLVADLDVASIRAEGVAKALRDNDFRYDARKRRVSLTGRREVRFPYRYLGADDRAGPNYTGQPAVVSHYE